MRTRDPSEVDASSNAMIGSANFVYLLSSLYSILILSFLYQIFANYVVLWQVYAILITLSNGMICIR